MEQFDGIQSYNQVFENKKVLPMQHLFKI